MHRNDRCSWLHCSAWWLVPCVALAAACAGEPDVSSPMEAQTASAAASAEGQGVTAPKNADVLAGTRAQHTVRRGQQSDLFLKVAPNAVCKLQGDGDVNLELNADDRGVVTFFAYFDQAGAGADLTLDCGDEAGRSARDIRHLHVRAVSEREPMISDLPIVKDLPYPGSQALIAAHLPAVPQTTSSPLTLPHEEIDRGLEYRASLKATEIPAKLSESKGMFHGPARDVVAYSISNSNSSSWCGFASTGYTPVSSAPVMGFIQGSWAVPAVSAPAGTASYHSGTWVGLGGGSTAVIPQLGTGQDVSCSGPFCVGSYYGWVEYYPAHSMKLTNVTVASGDVIFASVLMVNTSGAFNPRGPNASLRFSNNSRSVVVTTVLALPSGSTFIGESADWIIERPLVNGSTAPNLPKFADTVMKSTLADAIDSSGAGASFTYGASGAVTQQFTMINGSNTLASVNAGPIAKSTQSLTFHWQNYR